VEDVPNNLYDLAKKYNSEVMDNDPAGPYILAGYSSGGMLAHEMARQLAAMGKVVETLAIIDTSVDKPPSGTKQFLKSQYRLIEFIVKSYWKHPLETFRYHKLDLKRRMYIFFLYLTRTTITLNDKPTSIYWNSILTEATVNIDLQRTT